MSRLTGLACLLLLAVAAVSSSQQANKGSITVAALRDDGVLIPFAQFSQGNWLNPYPGNNIATLEKPWFKVEPKISWHSWSAKGGRRTLTPSRVMRVGSHCQEVWGLSSDFPGEDKGENSYHENIGLAADAPVQLEGLVEITEGSERSEVLSILTPLLEKGERGEVAEKIPVAKRKAGNLNLLSLHRGPEIKGLHLYYVEAAKEYPVKMPEQFGDCNFNLHVSGWLSRIPGKNFEVLDQETTFTDCEFTGATHRLPLGMLSLNDRFFILTDTGRGEVYGYSVLEWTGSGIRSLLEAEAGGC